MIFGWTGGFVVPESFFFLPRTSSWAIIGRPSGAGVLWLSTDSQKGERIASQSSLH